MSDVQRQAHERGLRGGELFGVSIADPWIDGGAILMIGLAAYLPARQAASVNPVEVLRAE